MRIDRYMMEHGLTVSRAKAQEMIRLGVVTVDGKTVNKPSFDVGEDAHVLLKENPLQRYVGRGGLKLEAALSAFRLSPDGCVALDIGASSGGFTDCLLQNGARLVYAVDSGVGQLHPRLLSDPRVVSMEKYNARYLTPSDFDPLPRFAVMDVSFISQKLILPAIYQLMTEGGILVSLIKPQFELGRAALGKDGVVKSERLAKGAANDVCAFAEAFGFSLIGKIDSPIHGGDGNLEFLAAFSLAPRADTKG